MTRSICDVLATLPSGRQGAPLSWEEVGAYLREHCDRLEDRDRERRHRRRDDFYTDGGVKHIEAVIDDVFMDDEVKALRKKWAPYARFNNGLKRVVNEVSTVYAEPARRQVKDEANNAKYQELLELLDFDVLAQHINRLYNLHRVIFVGPRVRLLPDGTREPVIDVATPTNMRVVPHPNDEARVVGYLLRLSLRSVRSDQSRPPAWVLWTDHEWVFCDDRLQPIQSSVTQHALGVCRWVPIVRSVGRPGFWPGEEGEDLVAAHVAMSMAAVLLLKETKSATKQTFFQGEMASTARAQGMDTELPAELGEGVAATTVDMSMDLEVFTRVADHVLERAANAYGMSAALVKHEGVASADARELMRVPLRELRREQQPIFRRFERRLVQVLAVVVAADAPDLAFDPDGFRIDFGESQTPLSQNEELDLFEKERRLGLTNTIAFMQKRNPDLDDDQAEAEVQENIAIETKRQIDLLPLKKASGELGGVQAGGGSGMPPTPANAPPPGSEDQAA